MHTRPRERVLLRRASRASQGLGHRLSSDRLDGRCGAMAVCSCTRLHERRPARRRPVAVLMMVEIRRDVLLAEAVKSARSRLAKPVLRTQLLDSMLRVRRGLQSDAPVTGPRTLEAADSRDRAVWCARAAGRNNLVISWCSRADEVLGMEVTVVSDGTDAWMPCAMARPAVRRGVMDLHMPRMDGFEATRRIRACHAAHPR